MARIMILVYVVTTNGKRPIKGITKLVKLDFLLRYPKALERGLVYLGLPTDKIGIRKYEIENIESKMIRYKYGPWDPNYRIILSILNSQDLLTIIDDNDSISIQLTDEGIRAASDLTTIKEFGDYVQRSKIIKSTFGSLPATKLKNLMYDLVPEISSAAMGEELIF
jgi:hypothetical protein